jgi:hypothetical protein
MLAFRHKNSDNVYPEKACLQACKTTNFFQYYLEKKHWDIKHFDNSALSKLTKKEKINFILETLEKIKKEFDIEYVQINYKENSFSFEKPESTTLYDIYILVIFSRFLFSGDDFLVRTIERMYDLKDKYTAFESYIIASSDFHYGYYSINSYHSILDINKYRNLKNKQVLLDKTYRLNDNILKYILYKKGTYSDNNDSFIKENNTVSKNKIEEYYYKEYSKPDDFIFLINNIFYPNFNYCKIINLIPGYYLINKKYKYARSIDRIKLTDFIKTLKKGVKGHYLKGQKKYKDLEIFCNQQNININELLKNNE